MSLAYFALKLMGAGEGRLRERERGSGGRKGREEVEGGEGGGKRRKRESGSKIMVITNTCCMHLQVSSSFTYIVSCHHKRQ